MTTGEGSRVSKPTVVTPEESQTPAAQSWQRDTTSTIRVNRVSLHTGSSKKTTEGSRHPATSCSIPSGFLSVLQDNHNLSFIVLVKRILNDATGEKAFLKTCQSITLKRINNGMRYMQNSSGHLWKTQKSCLNTARLHPCSFFLDFVRLLTI